MSKMMKKAKAAQTAKIPRGLSDKDMLAGFVEEESLEEKLLAAEKAAEKRRKEEAAAEPPMNLARAGLTPDIMDRLGKELLQLKMELYREDIKSYTMQIKREGKNIILSPKAR